MEGVGLVVAQLDRTGLTRLWPLYFRRETVFSVGPGEKLKCVVARNSSHFVLYSDKP